MTLKAEAKDSISYQETCHNNQKVTKVTYLPGKEGLGSQFKVTDEAWSTAGEHTNTGIKHEETEEYESVTFL